uniref:Reverse transcriptase domain-containing protein n=1 Tax=Trichobilharzia regenti TaxID=157069 RepID=A0AA85KKT7_TRIRE|nr:unnamed protein product [Trichobilharzia regenti]
MIQRLSLYFKRGHSNRHEGLTREEQAGFRSGRGCIDHVFTLRQLLEHRHTYCRPTTVVFLDIKAAFDSLDRTVLWNCLLERGAPEKFVNILKALYRNTLGRVKAHNQLSSLFPTKSGVRQGCLISPFLFNFAIDDILESAVKDVREGGVDQQRGDRLFDFEYADDIVLLCDSMQAAQIAYLHLLVPYSRLQISPRLPVGSETPSTHHCWTHAQLIVPHSGSI